MILRSHALTLIVFADLRPEGRLPALTGSVCACTLYLVFKEPTDPCAQGTRNSHIALPASLTDHL